MHLISDAHFSRSGVTADQFVTLAFLAEQDAIMQQELARRVSSDPALWQRRAAVKAEIRY